ncbi:HET domain-containing protein [Colletotrichum plurivorum]|uniref:HET domain-containing protein n=1 Tax=Colletotrichum plurivorum TaxID=2175906 RepID=A0A8H6KN38_9PEZI|nr:HET domain-containing protein [Colletotrichum plurivorum]
MPVFNAYHYEALPSEDTLRLVLLDPATDWEAPLSCMLVQCRRSAQTTAYSAISYAWGGRNLSHTLEVRCDGDTAYLKITANADALLRRLRQLDEQQYFWMDAICLNQPDELEKAQQIPRMGRIYEEAEIVHIWLGPSDHQTAKIYGFLRAASHLPLCELPGGSEQRALAQSLVSLMKAFLGDEALVGLRYLFDFFERPWFSRRWVIQEARLAREAVVHCGHHSIPLSLLSMAAMRIQSLDMAWYHVSVAAVLREPAPKFGILELLWYFHQAECLEPKDRIAALLGLVRSSNRFHLDYNVHWTELYRQLASVAFSSSAADTRFQALLQLFEFGPVCHPEDASYPSWIPDWSRPRQRKLPYFSRTRNADTYERFPTSPRQMDKDTLILGDDGLRIQWRASVGGPNGRRAVYARSHDNGPLTEVLRAEKILTALRELFPNPRHSITQILALSSLNETIVCFRHSRRDRRLTSRALGAFIGAIQRMLPSQGNAAVLRYLEHAGSLLEEFCLFQVEPFESQNGRGLGVGLGPKDLDVGDALVPLWSLD